LFHFPKPIAILAIFATFLALGIWLFIPSSNALFTSDDFVLMTQIREGKWQFFSDFGVGSQHYWRPLVLASLEILPSNTAAHHLYLNTVLHLSLVAIIYACCRLRGARSLHAAFVAFVFMVHWSNATNVYWVSARTDLLSCFFLGVALLSYFAMKRWRSYGWVIAALFSFGCALLSKEHAVMFPFIVCVFWMWDNRGAWRWGWLTSMPTCEKLFWLILPLLKITYLMILRLCLYQGASSPVPGQPATMVVNSIKSAMYAVLPLPVAILGKGWAAALALVLVSAIWFVAHSARRKGLESYRVLFTGMVLFFLAGAPMLVFLNQSAPRLIYMPLAVTLIFLGSVFSGWPRASIPVLAAVGLVLVAGSTMEKALWQENMALARQCQNQFKQVMEGKNPQQPFVLLGAPATRKGHLVFGNDMNHALFFATYGRFGSFPNGAAVGQIDWPGGPLRVEGGYGDEVYSRCISAPASYRFDPKAKAGDRFTYGPGETVVVDLFRPGQCRCLSFRFHKALQVQTPLVFDFDGENLVNLTPFPRSD